MRSPLLKALDVSIGWTLRLSTGRFLQVSREGSNTQSIL